MFKGLGNLANLGSMLKQAQQMGSKLEQINEELKAKRTEASAGGGLVTVEVNGLGEVLGCRIDPSLFASGDRELVEDLLPAAFNAAAAKAKALHADAMKAMAAGLEIPGLEAMLSQLPGGEGPRGGS